MRGGGMKEFVWCNGDGNPQFLTDGEQTFFGTFLWFGSPLVKGYNTTFPQQSFRFPI